MQQYDRLLRQPEVSERTGLSRGAIYSFMGRGVFPRPVKIGRSIRWRESDISNWIENLQPGAG